jgi:hypothetical protein
MKKTYGLPTFFAFYVFFVWSSDGEIKLHRDFIDQSSCEAVAKTFKEEHKINWKELGKEETTYKRDGVECNDIAETCRAVTIRKERTTEAKFYPSSWKSKCIPASEWPF